MTPIAAGGTIGIAISLLGYLWLAKADSRGGRDLRQFFFYDWSLGSRTVAATIFASGMSLATVIIALLQLGCVFGIALMWATITYCTGWVLLVLVAPRIKSALLPTESLHGFLGRSYDSRRVTQVASLATIIGFVGTFSTELLAGGIILEALGFAPRAATAGIITFGAVKLLYSSSGGFRSVIRSDRIQATLIFPTIACVIMLGVLYWKQRQGPAFLSSPLAGTYILPMSLAINLALINIPFPLVDMSAWQRVSAATSATVFRRGGLYASLSFFVTWTVLIGVAIMIGPVLPEGVDPFVELLTGQRSGNTAWFVILGLFLFPGLVAAMFSTADTFLNAAGHTYSLDIRSVRVTQTGESLQRRVRLHVFIMGVIGLSLALGLREIGFGVVELVFAAYGGTLALFAPVTVALAAKGQRSLKWLRVPAMVSIVLGVAAAWINGFYSTIGQSADGPLWAALKDIIPTDVYRSPSYAFAVSTVTFLVLGIVAFFRREDRSTHE